MLTDPRTYLRLLELQHYLLLGGLALWPVLETIRPALPFPSKGSRFRHIARNAAVWILTGVVASLLVGGYMTYASVWLEANRIGLLLLFELPVWAVGILGVLLMDLGDYLFHRVSHSYRIIWLFHAVHHSDRHLDFSSSLRVHPVHALMLIGWKLLFLTAMGVPMGGMARDALAIVSNQFHHANIVLPERIDGTVRQVLVTPSVHRVHHSCERLETDSNFGGLLVFWDKLFGTYREPTQPVPAAYGLRALANESSQTLWGMIVTPWVTRRLASL